MKNPDRRLLTILLIVFVQMLGGALVLPVLPLYAQRDFLMEPRAITLLVSSYFIALFFAGPALGRLSDVRGRLPVLVVSQLGTVISFVLMALAGTPLMLFIARILDGITGGNIIVAQAYVTDITPRARRTEVLGLIFAAFGLGFIFGPALGGLISSRWGEGVTFWVAAGISLLTLLLTVLFLRETVSPEQCAANARASRASIAPAVVLRNAPLMFVLVVTFLTQYGLGVLQSTFALFGDAVIFAGYSEEMVNLGIGLLLTVVGVAQFITQSFLLRPLLRRYKEGWMVVAGSLARAAGSALFAVSIVPWIAVIASIFFPFGIGIMLPALQALATRAVPDELRGGVLGLYQSSISLAIIFGTASGGWLFEITPATPYWVSAGAGLLAAFAALALNRLIRAGRFEPAPVPAGT
jgi:DHA1 family tetracycline resistance protein-like MFS transporter